MEPTSLQSGHVLSSTSPRFSLGITRQVATVGILIITLFTPAAHAQSTIPNSGTIVPVLGTDANRSEATTPAQDPSAPPRDWLYRTSQLAHLMGHGADLGSTFDALQRPGFREANPALAWASDRPAVLGATKMALAAVTLWITNELYRRGHKGLAKAMNFALGGVFVGVAIANGRTVEGR